VRVIVYRINDFVTKMLMIFSAMWAFALAFYILADVVARNINMPIEGTAEIARDSIVTIVFLQIAYCVHIRGMLRADFFVNMFPAGLQKFFTLIGFLFGIAFFAGIFAGAFDPAIDAWNTGEYEGAGALQVPVWPARFAILIGCALASFSYLLAAIKLFIDPDDAAGQPDVA
jgi:TRAP-type C4-dicarboxylate transport system permease small subunit